MIEWLKNVLMTSAKRQRELEDREKMAQLEEAERELASLRERGDRAVTYLRQRHERNHWSEAISEMIAGTR